MKTYAPFPCQQSARRVISSTGYNMANPDDWKPFTIIGPGVQEIRIRDASGAFRIIYLARLPAAIYVLHCFQKKTQKTGQADQDLAARRYRDLLKEPGS